MSDDDNYGSEEEYEYQYSDEDDDNSSSQPMAIDSDVDDASDGSRKRKAGTAGSNGGGAADSRRRSGSNVHNAMMELIDGGGGELPVCVQGLILGVGGCVAVAGCKPPRSPGRAGLLPPFYLLWDFGRHPRAGVEYRTGRIANFGGGSCPGLTEVNSAGLSSRNCFRPTHAVVRWSSD